ncbi:hypothetical protein [Candidatus Erwinia haradaeae]|uniref:hypothetical protein n=1 Tax=Candidatus Erwinia haradaeae TaxID=1922217 RepID=UPI001300AA7C|nr:hypothetical protein [Candidatus Erwinia haradaeae]
MILPNDSSVHDYSLNLSDVKHIKDVELIILFSTKVEELMTNCVQTVHIDTKIEIDLLSNI